MSWRTRAVKHRRGYWLLAGHAEDVSGYGNDGTLVNSPTWADGPYGRQCIEFDGDDAHVNLGDLTYLNAVSAFTIAFWMNQDVIDITDIIFRKTFDANEQIRIMIITGLLYVTIERANSGNASFDYSTVISATSWHHFAAVFDGGQIGDANRLIVYVDGVPVTLTFHTSIPALTSGSLGGVDATIGADVTSFDGKLFDLQIFNAPLTRDEVNAVMRGHG